MTKRAKRFSMSFSEAEFRAVCDVLGASKEANTLRPYVRMVSTLARYDAMRLHAEREEAAK